MESNTENSGLAWRNYAIAALALIIFIFIISIVRSNEPSPPRQTETDLANIYTGDLKVKSYFYSQYAAKSGTRLPQSIKTGQMLTQALNNYKSAAKHPSPMAIRRAGVMSYELHKEGELKYFNELTSPVVLNDLPPKDARKLRSEARMWHDVYAGELTARQIDEYARQIDKLNLGPTKAFALEHLYNRAGQFDRARQAIAEGESRAAVSMISVGMLFVVLSLAGLAGIVFIGLFIANRQKWLARREMEPANIPSGALFQGFIAYLISMIVLGLVVGTILSPVFKNISSEPRALYVAMLEFGLSVISGLIGLAVIYRLARRSGDNLAAIGLTLKDFWVNVFWGIAGYCSILPLLLVAMLIWNAISRAFLRGVETPVNDVIPMFLSGNRVTPFIVVLLGSVLAPFFEEIFFRGALYNALRSRMKLVSAIVLSAAAFAIIHPFPGGFLPIFTIAAVFAVLFETRRSLIPSMIAHAINNSVAFFVIYLILVR